jgi:hypothetical protein
MLKVPHIMGTALPRLKGLFTLFWALLVYYYSRHCRYRQCKEV